jgi:glycosyltransferase involved in cell wall biosynthesis
MCIVVPVFNDWGNADLIVENFIQCNLQNVMMLIIDNGSSTSNQAMLDKSSRFDNLKVVRIEENVGFGGGVQEAIKHTKSDWLVWIPGNMKVIPSEMSRFLGVVKNSNPATFVKAQRASRPIIDTIKSKIASLLQSLVAGMLMSDTGGTPSAVHVSSPLIAVIERAPKDYLFDSYVLFYAKKMGIRVERPPVPYHKRLIGVSHWQSGFKAELKLMMRLVFSILQWRNQHALQSKGDRR